MSDDLIDTAAAFPHMPRSWLAMSRNLEKGYHPTDGELAAALRQWPTVPMTMLEYVASRIEYGHPLKHQRSRRPRPPELRERGARRKALQVAQAVTYLQAAFMLKAEPTTAAAASAKRQAAKRFGISYSTVTMRLRQAARIMKRSEVMRELYGVSLESATQHLKQEEARGNIEVTASKGFRWIGE